MANKVYDIGTVPRFFDRDSDVDRSQQLRNATSKHRSRRDRDLGAKMAAARISVALTGKPPAPSVKGETSARNSNSSSSSSSSGKASSSSSLITQGLLAERMAHSQVTPHTSPAKDEAICGRPVKGLVKGSDILGTIRELAAQNGGLPDEAVDDASSYASTVHFSQHQRAFSFVAGDDASSASGCPSKAQPSQRPQQSTADERPLSSQLDGLAQDRGAVAATSLNHQLSESSDASSGDYSDNSHSSILLAMDHNRNTNVGKVQATTSGGDLDEPSKLAEMTKVMALQRDAVANNLRVSPTKKVQERRVPRTSQSSTDEETQCLRLMSLNRTNGRARFGDEELALTTLNRPSRGLAQHRAQGHLEGPTAPSAVNRLPYDVGGY